LRRGARRATDAAVYDAIVIGARCAGSPTAMLLARRGHRVLLLDRGAFPSDTISTHIVWPTGVACLERWGLRAAVAATGCPGIRTVSFDTGDAVIAGTPPPWDGAETTYAPRRTRLDALLVDAAVGAGVELRCGVAVQELLVDGDRVTGIRGRTRGGTTVEERARIVIGADGVHSIVARRVRAAEYDAHPTFACWYYSYWSGVPASGIEYYARPARAFGIIPTNDGLVCVPVASPHAELERFRADIEGSHLATLDLVPALAARVRAGRREERFYGMADVPSYFRTPHGPGWALVGDAGYHKDPITGQGISDAFRDAERLAQAIDEGFAEREPLDAALTSAHRRRDGEVREMYDYTCQQAALEAPPPEMQRLFAALAGNQPEADRFIGTLAGTVSSAEFFSEESQRRIAGA
jgi:flavin-dependent dehydrogenase